MASIPCDYRPDKPVRKIGPTWRSLSGRYAFRSEKTIAFESTLERDFLIQAEFCLAVAEVIEQPTSFPFITPTGRASTYTPDFLVYHHLKKGDCSRYQCPLLVEIKYADDWRQHYREWFPKWKVARAAARERGWQFRIHDESRIRGPSLANIRFLQRYRRMGAEEAISRVVIQSVADMGSTPLHYLVARHFLGEDRQVALAHLWHLVATRRLDCDIQQPLNEFTVVWATDHD